MSSASTSRRRAAAIALAALAWGHTPASAADPKIQQEKILNLGLFAGYVVACKVATKAQAAEMFERLSAGLGELTVKEKSRLNAARRAGQRTECPDGPLKKAVERGWSNYVGANFAPEPPTPGKSGSEPRP
ncbi:hypothetical protein [Hansschlegelia sp.]|uniref:hypothetical protein n=1 Tax=Hansschlegelia sp. TaxID=2041892 RepID=UPI002C8ED213|nr:hypothetical protein [Hansschlegelia sp.]HVI28175.1 hypothetical protein [Hansschlegelia sp.]